MHTLLPFDDYKLTALALTNNLLRRQIDDCITILEIVHETGLVTTDFRHPTVEAWRGCELQLCEFGLTCADTLQVREPNNTSLPEKVERLEFHLELAQGGDMEKPKWFGLDWVHLEYQGLLRWIDPATYDKVFVNVQTCPPERFRYPTVA
jgi:hypothetical protein